MARAHAPRRAAAAIWSRIDALVCPTIRMSRGPYWGGRRSVSAVLVTARRLRCGGSFRAFRACADGAAPSAAADSRHAGARVLAAVALSVSGCTVGPDYVRPTAPTAPAYTGGEQEGWKPAEPRDEIARGAWWEIYGDPELNQLEEQVGVANQNLFAVEAQFRQARARSSARALELVSDSSRSAYRWRARGSPTTCSATSAAAAAPSTTSRCRSQRRLGAGSVGTHPPQRRIADRRRAGQRRRRGIAAAQPAGELAADYFQLRAHRRRARAARPTPPTAYERSLKLTQSRYDGGVASRADVAQAQTQLETHARAGDRPRRAARRSSSTRSRC